MAMKKRLEELLIITEELIETGRTSLKKLEENKDISVDDFSKQSFELNKVELYVRQIKKELA